jgi:aminoglycoside 3-N-acetyltransferase
MPEATRSLHPTHSVAACGPLAAELIAGHELATTPCGRGTPYARLLDADGQVLLLGVGLESNTVYHTVEALSEVGYLLEETPRLYTIVDRFGERRELSVSCHCNGFARRFGAIEPLLVQQGILHVQQLGAGRAMLFNGLAFRNFMMECLQRDPAFLLASQTTATPTRQT